MSSNVSTGDGIFIPEAKVPEPIFWTMAAFAAAATLISFVAVWYHFRNYTMPRLQRYVIRIHLMVPIYAISSVIALRSLGFAFYIDAIRDIYEGFVLYCFFNLLVLKLGGERAFLSTAVKRQPVEHHVPVRWFSKDVNVGDPDSFRHIKRCIMLFVCVKPLVAVTTVVLKANGYYVEGLIAWTSTYLWLSIVSTISACLSLYYICLFVEGVENDIKEFKPVKKLLWVKAIIFFAFWQGVAISLLISTGIWADANHETAIAIQDSLICVEALVAAFGHWDAFSYKEYAESSGLPRAGMRPSVAIKDAFGSKDIVQDFTETWSGEDVNYREYEPSEGMAKDSKDQMRRIRDGLRYSQGGTSKYWLPEDSSHGPGHQNGSIHKGDVVIPVSIPEEEEEEEEQQEAFDEFLESGYVYMNTENKEGEAILHKECMEYCYIVVTLPGQEQEQQEQQRANESTPLLKAAFEKFTKSEPDTPTGTSVERVTNEYWGHDEKESDDCYRGSGTKEGCLDNVNGYMPMPKNKMIRNAGSGGEERNYGSCQIVRSPYQSEASSSLSSCSSKASSCDSRCR